MTSATVVRGTKASIAARAQRPARSAPDWRAQALLMSSQLDHLVQAAMQNGEGPEAWTLMNYGRVAMAKVERFLHDATVPAGDMLHEAYAANACLLGAHSIPHTPIATKALLEKALPIVDAIGTLLDNPSLDVATASESRHSNANERPDTAADGDKQPITRDTELPEGGSVAQHLMRSCTYEIESLSKVVFELADINEDDGCVARAAGMRIHDLNSLLMSYLTEDAVTLGEADFTINRDWAHQMLDELIAREGGQQ